MTTDAEHDQAPNDTPPKRTRAPRGQATAAAPKQQTKLERFTRLVDIRAWVATIHDTALTLVPKLRADALSEDEFKRLTESFDVWQANDPRLHKYVDKALKTSPGVAFAVVCVGITLDRLARHNMLPFLPKQGPVASEEPQGTGRAPDVPGGSYGPPVSSNGHMTESAASGAVRVGGMP